MPPCGLTWSAETFPSTMESIRLVTITVALPKACRSPLVLAERRPATRATVATAAAAMTPTHPIIVMELEAAAAALRVTVADWLAVTTIAHLALPLVIHALLPMVAIDFINLSLSWFSSLYITSLSLCLSTFREETKRQKQKERNRERKRVICRLQIIWPTDVFITNQKGIEIYEKKNPTRNHKYEWPMSEQATLPTLTKKRGRKIKRSKATKISRGGREGFPC